MKWVKVYTILRREETYCIVTKEESLAELFTCVNCWCSLSALKLYEDEHVLLVVVCLFVSLTYSVLSSGKLLPMVQSQLILLISNMHVQHVFK